VRAIKKFYAALGYKDFPNRTVARDAFLAGNDMLLLSEFADSGDYQQQLALIEDTIQYFRDSYGSDSEFRARVEESVKRILRLKLLLYGDFAIDKVLPAEAKLAEVGRGRDQVFQVARDAITLVSPDLRALKDRVPNPPSRDDDILIFTDVREARQCSSPAPADRGRRAAIGDRAVARHQRPGRSGAHQQLFVRRVEDIRISAGRRTTAARGRDDHADRAERAQ
jgi:beta-N-acetylhexosaminidase